MSHVIMEETGVPLAYTKCWVNTKVSSWTPSFRISSVDIQSPILSKCSEVTQVSGAVSWKSTSNSCLLAVAYVRVEHRVFVGSPKAHVSGSWLPTIGMLFHLCVSVSMCVCVCARMSCVWVPTEAKRGHQMPWSWSSCKPSHFCLSTLCLSAYSLQETNSFTCHMRLSQTSALLQMVSYYNSIANTIK